MSFTHPSIRRSALRASAVALAGCALFALAGCGGAGGPAATADTTPNGHPDITMRLNGDYATLDPTTTVNTSSETIAWGAYDFLVAFGPDGKLIPWVAKSWTQTPTSATFVIRDGVTCTDGAKMTPDNVAKAIRFYLGRSPLAARGFGPPPYRVTADAAKNSVTIGLSKPDSDFVLTGVPQMPLVCPAGVANPTSLATKPDGSGPYVVTSAQHGMQVVLTARSGYNWGPMGTSTSSPGFPRSIRLVELDNDTTAANELITGSLDYGLINGPDVQRLLASPSLTSQTSISYNVLPLVMNELPGHATSDPVVRAAIQAAVNSRSYLDAAYGGRGVASSTFLMPGAQCYAAQDASGSQRSGSSAAKQILLAAGYTPGPGGILQKGGKALTVTINGSTSQGAGPEYISSALNAAGIGTVLKNVPYQQYALVLQSGSFDLAIENIPSSSPAPGTNVAFLTGSPPPHGLDFARIIDPAVNAEVAKAYASEGTARCQAWDKAEQLLVSNHDIVPLGAPTAYWFGRGGVKALVPSSLLPNMWAIRG